MLGVEEETVVWLDTSIMLYVGRCWWRRQSYDVCASVLASTRCSAAEKTLSGDS